MFLIGSHAVSAQKLWQDGSILRKQMRTPQQVFQKRPKRDPIVSFDYPIEYNSRVQTWVRFFQTRGRKVMNNWLRRSQIYLPHVQRALMDEGLPADLGYMAMIESGFITRARSPAAAVGPWQFINETGNRYGLETTWWLDERMDFEKSTKAAAKYLKFLYKKFNCWNLAAAGYNTGENRITRLVDKHNTRNFWKIANSGGIPTETQNYVPKLIAAMLIAKSPELYGFQRPRDARPLRFERFAVPGGTRLDHLAHQIGVSKETIRDLNPELIRGYIPFHISMRTIRIPPGKAPMVSRAIRSQLVSSNEASRFNDKN